MQNYNLYLILNSNLSSEDIAKELKSLQSILTTDLNAQNINVTEEGLRKMAYPMNKNWTGFYVNVDFDLDLIDCCKVKILEKKINLRDNFVRYMILNNTDFLIQKSKEKLNNVEISSHRELNKNVKEGKKCISKYIGIRELDYKDTNYLNQFTSPYAKIFSREKTGSSAKFQRKIGTCIKRARHMGLMPFTNIHEE
jgi:small subunit ribosomal protein S18